MKKPTLKSIKWLTIHSRNANRRRFRTRRKFKPILVPGLIRIGAPAVLCLSQNYEPVVSLIDRMQKLILTQKGFVDFRTIKTISPDAALLLAAMLDMWQRLRNVTLRTRHLDRWSPDVVRIFNGLGLFELLKTPTLANSSAINRPEDFQILKLCSGEGSDGSLANQLTESLRTLAGEIDARKELFVGLTEAMTNVTQHAYPADRYQGVDNSFRRWWMTGSYEPKNKSMRILILDLGVGIPSTLPRSGAWEWCKGFLAKIDGPDDADRIEAAVEAGRTSTRAAGRGNGLDDIRKFVEESAAGRLRILSGHGEVIYNKGNDHPEKTRHASSIPGTLIEWEVFR